LRKYSRVACNRWRRVETGARFARRRIGVQPVDYAGSKRAVPSVCYIPCPICAGRDRFLETTRGGLRVDPIAGQYKLNLFCEKQKTFPA
jgi:hypothetical protein